jgi:hypothetical protein
LPQALLFTSKTSTSPLSKFMSTEFRLRMLLAEVECCSCHVTLSLSPPPPPHHNSLSLHFLPFFPFQPSFYSSVFLSTCPFSRCCSVHTCQAVL